MLGSTTLDLVELSFTLSKTSCKLTRSLLFSDAFANVLEVGIIAAFYYNIRM